MLTKLLTHFRNLSARETTASELRDALRADRPPVLIDIRRAEQYAAGHLPGAVHIPPDRLGAEAAGMNRFAPTVVY